MESIDGGACPVKRTLGQAESRNLHTTDLRNGESLLHSTQTLVVKDLNTLKIIRHSKKFIKDSKFLEYNK